MDEYFDYIISNELDVSVTFPSCLAELIFAQQEFRNEDSTIICSHVGNNYTEVSLSRFRAIIFSLYKQFQDNKINVGDTVLLGSIPGNNELFISLMFGALASYGVKVLLPMFVEIQEIERWMEETDCKAVILPESEISSLKQHDNAKSIVRDVKAVALKQGIICYDIYADFKLDKLIVTPAEPIDYCNESLYKLIVEKTSLHTESLLITTSGSSGRSKIIHYNQEGFIHSCLSWQQAGFFKKDLFGGRCFTPMFTHTMGIRAFFNAVWTGNSVCIINTEWFVERPEVVRYFLMKMLPEHITGGPSIYKLFLELMRCYPELKTELSKSFKTLISSGAPIDKATIKEIESAFGVTMHNAFGTTETQQALSTLLQNDHSQLARESLGAPLPGVKIGLKKVEGTNNCYDLYIQSSLGMNSVGYNATDVSNPAHGFFKTGDVVRLDSSNLIFYEGREKCDFIKDGFGVKIPVKVLKKYYQTLEQEFDHIAYYPTKGSPGISALIFIYDELLPQGSVIQKSKLDEVSGRISEVNNQLIKELEPFEYRHRSIIRFILINDKVPVTVKGNVSRSKLKKLYAGEINKLIELFSDGDEIKDVEKKEEQVSSFSYHHNPRLGEMLKSLGIDYVYHRAHKDSLFTKRNEEEVEILDFTGGFGTNLLGHNNSDIKKSILDFLNKDAVPISNQGSVQKNVGALAEKLNSILGPITHKVFNVVFGSTGSEAVEIALHHALLEWYKKVDKIKEEQYRIFGAEAGALLSKVWDENSRTLKRASLSLIALKDAFHGHTLGARNFLGHNKKREKFKNLLGVQTIFIDDAVVGCKEDIEKRINNSFIKLKRISYRNKTCSIEEFELSTLLGAIVEPVIGEGGIRVVDKQILKYLSEFSFPLIIDEIQCGLGRTGSFLASEGINGDYYLFAKALGGGYEKISAVLIDKARYRDEFSDYYSSTFANGGLAAHVAIKTLEIIINDKIAEKSKKAGLVIRDKLMKLKLTYSDVIKDITGEGLMQGIAFCDLSCCSNFLLRSIYTEKYLGLLFSTYLLKEFEVRILPSLSSPNVLRIEPSAYITDEEIDRLIIGLESLCIVMRDREIYQIFKPLMDNDPFTDNKGKLPKNGFMYTGLEEAAPGAKKVAMIAHFVHPAEELRSLSETLCKASDTGLWILSNKLQVFMQMKPIVVFSKNILHQMIHFSLIVIPIDSAELERLYRRKKQDEIIKHVQKAVDLAISMDIKTISLGAYTSIVTNNGLAISNNGLAKIITGNTLTAASGIKRILEAIKDCKETKIVCGIIGASGNIGSVITQSLYHSSSDIQKIIVFGRNKNKLHHLVSDIEEDKETSNNTCVLQSASSFDLLKECHLIIVATNTNDPIVFPHHIREDRNVIICDISVPKAVSEGVYELENVVPVNFASQMCLPDEPDFVISSHTPKGTIFCCGAEAILNGLEPINSKLLGKISIQGVNEVTQLADKYHFFDKLEDVKSYKVD